MFLGMKAIETRAVIEGADLLRLQRNIELPLGDRVRLIMLVEAESDMAARDWPDGFIDEMYGSCADSPIGEVANMPFETNRSAIE